MNTENLNTWIEISEKAYAQNLNFFKNFIPKKTELSAVVKANAYGHGLKEIVKLADRYGAQSFCVHTIEEALHIREGGYEKDILIMGPVPHGLLPRRLSPIFAWFCSTWTLWTNSAGFPGKKTKPSVST